MRGCFLGGARGVIRWEHGEGAIVSRHTLLLALILLAAPAQAHPPAGAPSNPEIIKWFDDLRSREGWSCCDVVHCRPAALTPNDDGRVFAFIDKQSFGPTAPDAWREVPLKEMRVRRNRPPGIRGAIICYADDRVICADLEPAT